MAEIRLLGPVEVRHDDVVLRLQRRQQKVVFGLLALTPNHVVPAETLIDLLWSDNDLPRDARAVAQTRVSELKATLRRVLRGVDDIRLESNRTGYVLAADPEAIDAHRFTALHEQARRASAPEEAVRLARTALALWHGPALGGGLTGPALERLCAPLDSQRLTAVELLYTAELRLDHHATMVEEVVRAAAEHPTRENLMKLALMALHRSGRSGDALREYDRWRRWLAEELGVDPGRDIQELHLAILRAGEHARPDHGTPAGGAERTGAAGRGAAERNGYPGRAAADPPAAGSPRDGPGHPWVPHTLPPDLGDFVGRAREIATARRALTGARATNGVIALTGPGGVGKTALATHLAHLLAPEFPDGQVMINLRGFDRNEPASVADALSRLLRSFGLDPAGGPHAIDDRIDLYRTYVAQRRILVVLDNATSDDQVRALIPAGRGCAAIITSRTRIGGTLGADVEEMTPLPPADAVDLLAAIAGEQRTRRDPATAEQLCARCGHLPLAIRVAGARLQAKPHWTLLNMVDLLGDERRRLDQLSLGELDLRTTISLSYQGLDPAARLVFGALGDLGVTETTPWLAAALVDTTVAEAAAALEQLFDVQLLDVTGGDEDTGPVGAEGFAVTRYVMHDFVRLYARELAAERDAAERRAGRLRAYRAWLTVAEHAHSTLFGGAYRNIVGTSARRDVDRAVLDAIGGSLLSWFEQERPTIATIVHRAADDGATAECWELACTLSPLFEMCRYYDEWSDILERALTTARHSGDRRGEAAMLYRIGCALADRTDNDGAWLSFDEAARLFAAVGDAHGQATATAFTATIDRFRGDPQSALRRYQAALPSLRDSGDLGGEAQVLRGIGQVYLDQGAYPQADLFLDQSIVLYQLAGWPLGEAQGLFWHGMCFARQGRYREADLRFHAAREICRARGDRSGEAQTLRGLALCLRGQGHFDQARAALGAALRLVVQPRPTLLETHIRRAIAELDADPAASSPGPDQWAHQSMSHIMTTPGGEATFA